MKKRLNSLMALIVTCVLCLQMMPMNAYAAMNITTDYTLTDDSSADGYIVQSGGTLRFAENLTVNGNVSMEPGSGKNMYLIIPASATMNGDITVADGMGYIENAGTITSDLNLSAGTLTNSGKVANVKIYNSGMLYAKSGATFKELDISGAGSGMTVTEGTFSVDSLILDPYALSVMDSAATQINIGSQVQFIGTTKLDDMFKISVSDDAKIVTNGQSGLSVYAGGVKYSIPATVINAKTLGEIYDVSMDKTSLSFAEQPIGYQASESKTITVTNNGIAEVILKFSMGGEWDDMFKVTSDGETITESSKLSLTKGTSISFEITSKKGLSAAAHTGTFSVQYCTSEETVYDTQKVTGKLTVNKVPSISIPSGDFYTLTGTKGKNGFYTSNVKVTPVDGYLIAKTISDDFANTITYTATVKKPSVYLQKDATGQITEKATLSAILIDKEKPKVKNGESGKTYYKDTMTVTVTDDHLGSVTLNSGAMTVTDNKASAQLVATDNKVKYTIKAEDLAGNIRNVTFYLAPAWREDGTVPSGKAVNLYKNTAYKFGSGTWTVSGDATSYVGGNTFYVAGDGQYMLQSTN